MFHFENHNFVHTFSDKKLPKPTKAKQRDVPEYIEREDRIDKKRPKPTKLKPIPKIQSTTTITPTKPESSKKSKDSNKEKTKPQSKPQLKKVAPTKPKTDKRKPDEEGTFINVTLS